MTRVLPALLLAVLAMALTSARARASDDRTIVLASALDGTPRMEMQGEQDEFAISVMVPPMAPLRQVVLTIQYENGIDLLPERSRLLLAVNGSPVAELPLSANQGPVTAAITLPPERIRPGENRITFRQEAEHRVFCTVQGTFDLWSRVHLARSTLVLRSDSPPPAPDLAMLRKLLASSERGDGPLAILRVGSTLQPDQLGWGALIAQGYALAVGERAPRVTSVALPKPQLEDLPASLPGPVAPASKAVLVGPRDELAGVLAPGILQSITGPFLGVYPSGPVPGGFLIVVSGRTADEVDRAALRFADINGQLPPQTSAIVDALPAPAAARTEALLSPGRHRLAELGFPTATHTGYRYSGRFEVQLPADYKWVADRAITLRINAAFEGEIGRGAVLNVTVNGRIAGAIEVDRRSSGDIRRAEIGMPMSLFRSGRNRVEFHAELPPAQQTDCVYAVRRPRFTLYDTSELEVPPFARQVTMPDLGATARTGFPFRRPDRQPFELIVTGQSEAWQSAALTLVARLAQSAGEVLHPVPAIGWHQPDGRDALIVGPVGRLPEIALGGAQIAPDRLASLLEAGARLSQALAAREGLSEDERRQLMMQLANAQTAPVVGALPSADAGSPPVRPETNAARWDRLAGLGTQTTGPLQLSPQGILERVLGLVGWFGAAEANVAAVKPDPQRQGTELLPEAALLQFAGPDNRKTAWEGPGRRWTTWTVLTGAAPHVAEQAVAGLVTAPLWSKVDGETVLWRGDGDLVATRPADTYIVLVAPRSLWNAFLIVASNLSQRIDVLFTLLLGTVLTLAVSLHLLLRLGRRKE